MRLPKQPALWFIIAGLVSLLVAWALDARTATAILWPSPNHDTSFWPYSDGDAGGNSRVNACTVGNDGYLYADLSLGEPINGRHFVGLGLTSPLVSAASGAFGPGGNLEIRYKTPGDSRYSLLAQTEIIGYTKPGDVNTRRFFVYELPSSQDWRNLRLPLSALRTPDWWFALHAEANANPDDRDLSNIVALELVVSDSGQARPNQRIELASVRIEGNRLPALVVALVGGAWLATALSVWLVGRFRPRRIAPAPRGQTPQWVPLQVGKRDEEDARRIIDYIAQHYSNPELSLSSIIKELGISDDRVSPLLEAQTGLKFKPYLNQVRLSEAMRLLVESDRTVSEIAFLVGYSSLGHFNRVFKEAQGEPPLAFRKARSQSVSIG